ncbi:MAG: hypothetical protein AVDCRST_MAG71-1268 [uncultured Lysobacter sp.]|uniref:Uncharacterized protein n=1 Tax=uncultured Lysobacter sp. TaxID=271060 RepID=A0A6J4L2P0_9GAMM|nr:MAG: hypothetical protein AVDCRST_MAG71-1268 [uncultured Lysobacter sp.]
MVKYSPLFPRLFTAPVDKRLGDAVDKERIRSNYGRSSLFGDFFDSENA